MSVKFTSKGLADGTDETKELEFNVAGVTTGTTRTITVPDRNLTLGNAGDLTGALPAIDGSALTGTGKVLQVVQSTHTTSYNLTTSTQTVGSVTITPSATSSKVLLSFSSGGMGKGDANDIKLFLYRNGTLVKNVPRYGYQQTVDWNPLPIAVMHRDSPNTTSSVTYELKMSVSIDTGTSDVRINSISGVNGFSSIAQEIGA